MAFCIDSDGLMSWISTDFHGQAPVDGFVRDAFAQARLDLVAIGQRLVKRHLADDRAQRGHDHVADRFREIGHAVDRLDRIGDLDEGDGVGQDHRVVLGDDLLLLDIEDDVLGRQFVAHLVQIGNDDVETRDATWRGTFPRRSTIHSSPWGTMRTPLGDGDRDKDEHSTTTTMPNSPMTRPFSI
jgi:hypothetical protein